LRSDLRVVSASGERALVVGADGADFHVFVRVRHLVQADVREVLIEVLHQPHTVVHVPVGVEQLLQALLGWLVTQSGGADGLDSQQNCQDGNQEQLDLLTTKQRELILKFKSNIQCAKFISHKTFIYFVVR
jgi:hypothetical protein